MCKLTRESESPEDMAIIEATEYMLLRYPEDNLDKHWEDLKKCRFNYHIMGRGASHIWISRNDGQRVAIIKEEGE